MLASAQGVYDILSSVQRYLQSRATYSQLVLRCSMIERTRRRSRLYLRDVCAGSRVYEESVRPGVSTRSCESVGAHGIAGATPEESRSIHEDGPAWMGRKC